MMPTQPSDSVVITVKDMATGEVLDMQVLSKKELAAAGTTLEAKELSIKTDTEAKYLNSGRDVKIFKVSRV